MCLAGLFNKTSTVSRVVSLCCIRHLFNKSRLSQMDRMTLRHGQRVYTVGAFEMIDVLWQKKQKIGQVQSVGLVVRGKYPDF